MNIQQLHKRIKELLPKEAFLVVEHSLRNYEEMPQYNEMWTAHAYGSESGKSGDNQLFCLSSNESPEDLIEIAKGALQKPNDVNVLSLILEESNKEVLF